MKTILLLLALSVSFAFAYKESDFYGAWNITGEKEGLESYYSSYIKEISTVTLGTLVGLGFAIEPQFGFILFYENGKCHEESRGGEQRISCTGWRLRNNKIEITNSTVRGDIVSNKEIDFHIKDAFGREQILTLKKAANKKQFEKFFANVEKQLADVEKQWTDKGKQWTEAALKAKLSCLSNKNSAFCERIRGIKESNAEDSQSQDAKKKGEFETEEEYKKRIAEYDENMKNNAPHFCDSARRVLYWELQDGYPLGSIITPIKYNADEQSYEISARYYNHRDNKRTKVGIKESKSKVKMPTDVAKKFKENANYFYTEYPEYYITPDFFLALKSIVIYDSVGNEYNAIFDVPQNAKKISFSCSEFGSGNPYLKEYELSFDDIEELKKSDAESRKKHYYATYKIDNESYKAINMNGTIWLAKNMNRATPNSRCYDDKPENCERYGRLYDFKEAQNICPTGWHLSTKKEWQELVNYIGYDSYINSFFLKSLHGWDAYKESVYMDDAYSILGYYVGDSYNINRNGLDYYGFSALPGGTFDCSIPNSCEKGYEHLRFTKGGSSGYWWLSENNESIVIKVSDKYKYNERNKGRSLSSEISLDGPAHWESLRSVRCVRDKKEGE